MQFFIKKKKLVFLIAGIFLGMAGGYLYWYFVGCESGTCHLKQDWYSSVLIGALIAYLLADLVWDIKTKIKSKNH